LLDHEVVAFAASLPSHMKLHGRERKRVLKHVAAAVLPADVLTRRKQGFAVPLDTWFRSSLREFVVDTLQSRATQQRGYFQARFIDRVLAEHLAGRRDHSFRLWQLVMFELWHRRYLDRSSISHAANARGSSLPLSRAGFPQKDKSSPSQLDFASSTPHS
jgi:asparagine synthase (glutamine-hydrolysing)